VFARSLEKYLQRVERTLRVVLPVVLDDRGFDETIRKQREKTENAPPVKVPTEAENPIDARFRARLQAELRALAGQLDLQIPASADGDKLRAELGAQIAEIEKSVRVEIPTDPEKATELRRKLREQITAVQGSIPTVDVPVKVENPLDDAFRRQLQNDLRRLTSQLAMEIPTTADGARMRAQLNAQILEIERTLRIEIPVDPEQADQLRRKLRDQIAAVEASIPPSQEPVLRGRLESMRRRLSGMDIEFDLEIRNIVQVTAQVLALGGALSGLGLATLGGQAAAGGIVTLAAALSDAVGAVALLPAVGAAGAAAIGALVVGFEGIGDAIKADDIDEFREALKNLSPEAQATAVAVRNLGPAWRELRMAVQDSLFRDMADTITTLADAQLPGLKTALSGVAAQLNLGAREWVAFATSARSVADTELMASNITKAFAELAPAGALFSEALRDIAAVGSGFLPELAGGFTTIAEKFRDFISNARETGQLEAFIQRALDTLTQLGTIIGNVAVGFGNILSAGNTSGAGLLDIIEQITERFENFTASAAGQEAFGNFFKSAQQAAEAIMPVLEDLFLLFANDILPILAEIGTIVGPSVSVVLKAIGEALRVAEPGILAFAEGFGSFLEALAPALPALGELVGVLGESLGTILERVGPAFADVAEVLAENLAEALSNPELIDGIVAMAEAFGDLITELAPILPDLAELSGTILTALARVLGKIAPVLADVVEQLVDALAPHLPDLVDAFLDLVDALLPMIETLLPPLLDLLVALVPLIAPLVDLFVVWTQVLGPFIEILGLVLGLVADIVGGLVQIVGEFASEVEELFGLTEGRFREGTGIAAAWSEHLAESTGRVQKEFQRTGEAAIQAEEDQRRAFEGAIEAALAAEKAIVAAEARKADKIAQYTALIARYLTGDLGRATEIAKGKFGELPTAMGRAGQQTANEAQKLADKARETFARASFYASGASLGKGFADGIRSAENEVRNAARALAKAAANNFPSSPAVEGPFSGRGWTPYRGQALAEGFAEGMLNRVEAVRAAARTLAGAAESSLGSILPVGGDGTSSGGITVNNYGAPTDSLDSIAAKTSRVLAWNTKPGVTP
jgi:phage-related protein